MKRLTLYLTLSLLLMLSLFTACSTEPFIEDPLPVPSPDSFDNAYTNANNAFSIDMYHKFQEDNKNMFFSPYSITSALVMTYEGAKGTTAEEMQTVLHFPDDKAVLRESFLGTYATINKPQDIYKLETANALWIQESFNLLPEYMVTIKEFYQGRLYDVDYVGEPQKSRRTINNWVEDKTNNKIKDLIPASVITPDTRVILTNAIYFKGDWANTFKAKSTYEKPFTLSSGEDVTVKMMHDTKYTPYGETKNYKFLELPYEGDDLSMVILLPKENDISSLEKDITSENMANWLGELETEEVRIQLPKFTFETKEFMGSDLQEMGMPTAFSGSADFSGMTAETDLQISEVIHQTFIEVDEKGTEAAAATAVVMIATSAGPGFEKAPPKEFYADQPFIFLIQHKETGTILFMGKVENPLG